MVKAILSWEKLGKRIVKVITIKIKDNGGILGTCLVSVIFLVLGAPAFYQAKVYYTLRDLARGKCRTKLDKMDAPIAEYYAYLSQIHRIPMNTVRPFTCHCAVCALTPTHSPIAM